MGLCGTAQTVAGFPSSTGTGIVQADAHAIIRVKKEHPPEHMQLLSGDVMVSLCYCWGFGYETHHKRKLPEFRSW